MVARDHFFRFAVFVAAFAAQLEADDSQGRQIFVAKCASCHGNGGEGVADQYPNPLIGDRSLLELTAYIEKTMPEDKPGTCTGDEAKQVAAYIHDAFYSPVAQDRNRPARIELSRLTVRQYHNALADLVGTFRHDTNWGDVRGLQGEYFKSRGFDGKERLIDRVDPVVAFDFGEGGPDDKFDPHTFSIRWQGSVLAPDSGEYEFVVRTEHALRLWVNDMKVPLIDAWVKSGDDTEYRASIRLLGGKAFPVRLEISKAKQGVNDNKNLPPRKASVSLAWKMPKQVEQVIPARNLSPNRFAETYVSPAIFPPDDRSIGYERGTSISKAWDQATTEGALDLARYVATRLRDFSGANDDAPDRTAKLKEFCRRLVERAFRRPLSDEERQFYVEQQFASTDDPAAAVKRVVLLGLKSPKFLYREIDGKADSFNVASRLSFGLWDSIPDAQLLAAAQHNQLKTREQVLQQAERMLGDLRAKAKLRQFFLQWLKVEQVPELSKDKNLFPDFTPAIVTDLRSSLDMTIEDIAWSESSDFRQLFLANTTFLNGPLAKFYGVALPEDAPFQKVEFDRGSRSGVLSHPYLLSGFAYTATSSPIHRGVFVARSVLGRTLRPPPEAVAPLAAELHASLSTRERITLQTQSESCLSCHAMINPLGFPLEHFDAVGRYRSEEQGRAVDASGGYLTRTGEQVKFSGASELANYLASSQETHAAFVKQMFHHIAKQPMLAYGSGRQDQLRESFEKHNFSIRKLVAEIAAMVALGPTDSIANEEKK